MAQGGIPGGRVYLRDRLPGDVGPRLPPVPAAHLVLVLVLVPVPVPLSTAPGPEDTGPSRPP